MDKRFDQSALNKIGTLEKLLNDGANNTKIDDTLRQRLKLELSDFIDCQALVEELKDLLFALKVFNANSAVPIKKVTSLDTICDVMTIMQALKNSVPQYTLPCNIIAVSYKHLQRQSAVSAPCEK